MDSGCQELVLITKILSGDIDCLVELCQPTIPRVVLMVKAYFLYCYPYDHLELFLDQLKAKLY